jgi:predicted permease
MWKRRRTDDDFSDEIRAHIEIETERLVAEGLTPDDARSRAHRAFGNVTRVRERYREGRRFAWLDHLAQDLRYALRGLGHSRAFFATTVLTLGVGMSLVTTVFAVFNAYVLRPFALRDPYSLYALTWRLQHLGPTATPTIVSGSTFRWSDYEGIAGRRDIFDDVVAEVTQTVAIDDRSSTVSFVSGNYFAALGVPMAIGRGIGASDATLSSEARIVVLTDRFWQRHFDRDPAILGREILIDRHPFTVVGVATAAFAGLEETPRDLWAPLPAYEAIAGQKLFAQGAARQLRLTVRLGEGVTAAQAQSTLTLEPTLSQPGILDPVAPVLRPQATPIRFTGEMLAFFSPVFAAFGLVLAAACANASNMMLARANGRHREIGIRLSMGASRGRVVRQLMTEGLLVASLAGCLALALATGLLNVGTYAFAAMLPPSIAARVRFVPLDFDHRVFLFVLGVSATAMVLFALLPALQATRIGLTDALRGQPGATIRRSTLRNLLVTGQVAVSLILLVVSVTLVRNVVALHAMDVGFETQGIVSVRQGRGQAFNVADVHDRLAADPRVSQVAVTDRNPLSGNAPGVFVSAPPNRLSASCSFVSPSFFEMLAIPIVHGRGFSNEESATEAAVAIVSVSGAAALWPGEDPLGKTMRVALPLPAPRVAGGDSVKMRMLRKTDDESNMTVVTVVGVAQDIVSGFVFEGKKQPHLYLPTGPTGSRAAALLARGRTSTVTAGTILDIVRTTELPRTSFDMLPVDEMRALQMFPLRAAAWVGSILSAVALALSVSGLYGVLTYIFGQRRHELGVRLALGATASTLTRLVAMHAARLAAVGTCLGLVAGFSVMKVISVVIRLEGVSVIDVGAFATAAATAAASVAIASYGPARRASRIDPASLLRADS